jgi:hypothetical protein
MRKESRKFRHALPGSRARWPDDIWELPVSFIRTPNRPRAVVRPNGGPPKGVLAAAKLPSPTLWVCELTELEIAARTRGQNRVAANKWGPGGSFGVGEPLEVLTVLLLLLVHGRS